MMIDNRIRRRALFAVLLVLFFGALAIVSARGGIAFVTQSELEPEAVPSVLTYSVPQTQAAEGSCMGVPILTEQELGQFHRKCNRDFSEILRFGEVPAAVDREKKLIYIPQSIDGECAYTELQGTLAVDMDRYALFFAPDEAFFDLDKAMADSHAFRLLILDRNSGECAEYGVVFTNLPVLRLEGGFSNFDKDGENVLTGSLHLFAPEADGYTIKQVRASWHLRGATTSRQPKKSWKIDLIDEQRENVETELLGLGSDDDWVLNSMSLDDTRMKERLAMDTWNELAAETALQDHMSVGRYVELVSNGEYLGIYLLQRRIDENYLGLSEDTLLLKGRNTWAIASVADGYEIEYSPLSNGETFAAMEGWAMQSDCSAADLENFIDVNLFIQWGSMTDNSSYNNIYYVLQPNGEGYHMYMVPWDTDYSMGVLWYNDFFSYQQDMSAVILSERVEYDAMKQLYPDLDRRTAERWFALREGVYSEEAIAEKLESYYSSLKDSGAALRDRSQWGEFYGGQDSYESLQEYFRRRLEFLDGYYAEKLNK